MGYDYGYQAGKGELTEVILLTFKRIKICLSAEKESAKPLLRH